MTPAKRERDLAKMLIGACESIIDDWIKAGHMTEEDRSAQRLAVLRVAIEMEMGKQGLPIDRVFSVEE